MATMVTRLGPFGFLLEWLQNVPVVLVQTTSHSGAAERIKQAVEGITI